MFKLKERETNTMENVKVSILDKKPCEVSLVLEINADEVDKERDIVFNEILKQAKIPGFRQGKAPLDVVKKNYDSTARKQVMENLISRVIPEVLKENQIKAISSPSIEKYDFDFGKPFSLQLKVERQPDVKVKDYKKIKIKKKIYKVDDKQITEQVDALRDRNSRLVVVENEPAKKEHFAVVDYEGTIDGKKFPGGSAKNQMVNLSASQMIQGFAEGIIGANIGDTREVKVTFPKEYPQKEFAGKEAVFSITIREIKQKNMPAADDDFAKDVGFGSLNELKNHIKQDLEKQAEKKIEKEMRDQIFDHLLKTNEFQVPVSLVEEHANTMLERTKRYFKYQGYSETEWDKQKDASREKIKPEAEKQVRLSYIFSALAAAEKIETTPEDLNEELNKAIAKDSAKEKTVKQYYDKHKDDIMAKIKEDKLFVFLFDSAKIKIEK